MEQYQNVFTIFVHHAFAANQVLLPLCPMKTLKGSLIFNDQRSVYAVSEDPTYLLIIQLVMKLTLSFEMQCA